MIRKPQPKEAARAVAELLSRNGLEVSRALTLEIVATVDGFKDWNTMSAAIRKGNHLTPAALDIDVGPEVPDSAGPFKVQAGNITCYTMPSYAGACASASLVAADNLDADSRLVLVKDAHGKAVAAYIPEDSTIHTFSGTAVGVMPALSGMARFIEDNWDDENVCANQEQLRICLCDKLELAMKADKDSFMGYLQYETTESGRVLDATPPIIPVYYRQDGRIQINSELPDNLRLSLELVLSK